MAEEKADLLSRFEESGLSGLTFSRKMGLPYSSFCLWRRQAPAVSPAVRAGFAEVRLAIPALPSIRDGPFAGWRETGVRRRSGSGVARRGDPRGTTDLPLMFTLGGGARVYLATGTTDLRRSFSLYHVIEHQLGFAQPLNGDVFGFINRRRNLVKLFWFSDGGMCLLDKRLPEGVFRWPELGAKTVTITAAQLQLLLSGIDLTETRTRKWWRRERADRSGR